MGFNIPDEQKDILDTIQSKVKDAVENFDDRIISENKDWNDDLKIKKS